MVNFCLNRLMFVSIAIMLIACMSLSSCQSLRKKFTRQKKAGAIQSQDFQPVLEPQDYPAPENNPSQAYSQHYSLIKIWYKDLWTGIDERNNDSRVKYSIKQILDHIEEMKGLLKPEKSVEFSKLEDLLKYYQTALDQVREQRNYSRIQSDLRAFDRMLRKQFREDAVKKDFVK